MAKKDATFVVHPDTKEAYRQYRMGNKAAFEQMKEERRLDNKEGTPYWDTKFDWMYARIAKRNTAKFRAKGEPPFPKKKK
jgi:hypothetical protein